MLFCTNNYSLLKIPTYSASKLEPDNLKSTTMHRSRRQLPTGVLYYSTQIHPLKNCIASHFEKEFSTNYAIRVDSHGEDAGPYFKSDTGIESWMAGLSTAVLVRDSYSGTMIRRHESSAHGPRQVTLWVYIYESAVSRHYT